MESMKPNSASFSPSLCILSDLCGLNLSVSLPGMSPTFLIINRLLIFQQRTEEHTLAERREVTSRLSSAIVCEFVQFSKLLLDVLTEL